MKANLPVFTRSSECLVWSLLWCLLFSPARAAFTVSSPVVAEGTAAVFQINLKAPAAASVVLRYATVSGHAVDSVDFESRRGTVTVPAGETTAEVHVPVLPDAELEDDEEFGLLVWPAEGNLEPQLLALPDAETVLGPSYYWTAVEGAAPGGFLFMGGSNNTGLRRPAALRPGASGWEVDFLFPTPAGGTQFAQEAALAGDWFVADDEVLPGGAFGGNVRLHFWQRNRAQPGVWSSLTPLTLPRSEGYYGKLSLDGGWLATLVDDGASLAKAVRIHELSHASAPREAGRIYLPAGPITFRHLQLQGRRLLVVLAAGYQLYETTDATRSDWRLVLDRAGDVRPVLLDGDRMLALAGGTYRTFEKDAGGPGQWGEVAAGPAPRDVFRSKPVMRGNLLLIGEPGPGVDSMVAGEVRVFVREVNGGGWQAAGTFAAPQPAVGDNFGADLALAGLDIGVTGGSNRPGWAGSFSGGRAVILNDDLPELTVHAAAAMEPGGSGQSAFVQVALSRTATAPVTFSWQTTAGTATAGTDYVESGGTGIIAAGQWQTALRIPLLADALPEPDETVRVVISGAAGGVIATDSAVLRIRDTYGSVAAVTVTVPDGYEGAEAVQAVLEVQAPGPTPAVPWRTERIHRSDGVTTGYATPGADYTAISGLVGAGDRLVQQSATIAMPADTVTEGHEEFAVLAEPPPGAVGASFAPRLVHPLVRTPAMSTDGQWVAVVDSRDTSTAFLQGEVIIFRRDAATSAGWVEHTRLRASQFGGTVWRFSALRLRAGVLYFRDLLTDEAWIFAAVEGGPGQWGLVQRLRVPEGVTLSSFDGHTLLWCDPGSLAWETPMLMEAWERNAAGRWVRREALDASNFIPYQSANNQVRIAVDGSVAVLAGKTNAGYAALRILELEAGSMPGWRVAAFHILTGLETTGINSLLVHRDVVAVEAFGAQPAGVRVFRRGADGVWRLEQIVAGTGGLSLLDRGTVVIGQEIWTASAAGAAPWRKSGTLPVGWTAHSLSGGVLAASAGNHAVLAEPGGRGTIVDAQSLTISTSSFSGSESVDVTEPFVPSVELSRALVIPVSIPWRTEADTAQARVDFIPANGVLTVPPGQTRASAMVGVLPDTLLESTETFRVVFGPPSFGVQSEVTSTISILNRNIPFQLPTEVPVLPEPSAGQATYYIPVPLSRPVLADTVFQCSIYTISVGGGTPFAGPEDLTGGNFAITVPAGASLLRLPVTVLADAAVEPAETITYTVMTPAGYSREGANFAYARIVDGTHPGLAAPGYSVAEGELLTRSVPGVLQGNSGSYQNVRLVRGPAHGMLDLQPDGSFTYTPAPGYRGTDSFSFQAIESTNYLIAPGAATTWRWRHPVNGADPGTTTPGFQTNWKTPGFSDASWSTGSGLMGYGSIGPVPVLPLNTNIGTPPSGQRYTAYFRHSFTAAAAAPQLTAEFLCDDAAIFYLNGSEAGRFATLPDATFFTAPDSYTLLCETPLSDPNEATLQSITLNAPLLAGTNLLALSLHNQSSSSSDLGFRLHSLRTGAWSGAVTVSLTVTDADRPPVPASDSYTFPAYAPLADSRLHPGGSLFANDNLRGDDGTMLDPILEVQTGGSPAGPVTVEAATGHFRMFPPAGFHGLTQFTYRLRDEDGWSAPATVSVNLSPSSEFEIWQQTNFGGGMLPASAAPGTDAESDGHANLLEFLSGRNPQAAEPQPLLHTALVGAGVEHTFEYIFVTQDQSILSLQSTASPAAGAWVTEAAFTPRSNQPVIQRAGVSYTTTLVPATGRYQARVQTPFAPGSRFYRLHAAAGPQWWRND